jgi:hypothetical protein
LTNCPTTGLDPDRIHAQYDSNRVALASQRRQPANLPKKEKASEQLEVGQVFKMVLQFRQSFSTYFCGRFIHPQDEDVPVWWTPLPTHVDSMGGRSKGGEPSR